MKFGFFSADFSDQGLIDDGKILTWLKKKSSGINLLTKKGSWKFCGLDKSQRMFAFGAW